MFVDQSMRGLSTVNANAKIFQVMYVQNANWNPQTFSEMNLKSSTNCDVCMQGYDEQWAKRYGCLVDAAQIRGKRGRGLQE